MSTPLKALLIIVGLLLVVVLLFTRVFPWVERNLVTDPTMASWVQTVGPQSS